MVVISSGVSHLVDRHPSRSGVSQGSCAKEAEPFLPSEAATLPVRRHSRGHGKDTANSEEQAQHLDDKTTVAALSVEELLLSEEVLLRGSNNFVSSRVLVGVSLPVVIEIWVPDSQSVVGGV